MTQQALRHVGCVAGGGCALPMMGCLEIMTALRGHLRRMAASCTNSHRFINENE